MLRMETGGTLLLVPTELELAELESLGGFAARVELCGFGPVAAAARTAQLVAQHSPAEVLLLGIAGSFEPVRLPIGSVSSFREVAIDGIGAGFPQWAGVHDRIALAPLTRGVLDPLLLTACTASASPAQAKQRRERFPGVLAEDMEGFGVALACSLAGVPCTIVRGISNAVGERDKSRWRIPEALAAARRIVLEHLR